MAIKIHWVTASLAFFIGPIILLRKKGTGWHKRLGWTYVLLMVTTAISAIFIQTFEGSGMPTFYGFSLIHLFVPVTLFGLMGAIISIKKGDVKGYRAANIGVFLGGLVIAGSLTFLPGRHMYAFFFGG